VSAQSNGVWKAIGDGRYGGGFMEGGCILYYIRFIAWLLRSAKPATQDMNSIRGDENILRWSLRYRVRDSRLRRLDTKNGKIW
jgi:hypothetical protein